jgi:ubiquitin carboxyl-terminal hydrolase 22/27/51
MMLLEVLSYRSRKSSKCAPPLVYQYDLFSVVNHDGQLNTGHYTNFSRSHDEVRPHCVLEGIYVFIKHCSGIVSTMISWSTFVLDSPSITNALSRVTKARLSECLASTPYMCFYVRRQFEYKPSLPQLSKKSPPDTKPLINTPPS